MPWKEKHGPRGLLWMMWRVMVDEQKIGSLWTKSSVRCRLSMETLMSAKTPKGKSRPDSLMTRPCEVRSTNRMTTPTTRWGPFVPELDSAKNARRVKPVAEHARTLFPLPASSTLWTICSFVKATPPRWQSLTLGPCKDGHSIATLRTVHESWMYIQSIPLPLDFDCLVFFSSSEQHNHTISKSNILWTNKHSDLAKSLFLQTNFEIHQQNSKGDQSTNISKWHHQSHSQVRQPLPQEDHPSTQHHKRNKRWASLRLTFLLIALGASFQEKPLELIMTFDSWLVTQTCSTISWSILQTQSKNKRDGSIRA